MDHEALHHALRIVFTVYAIFWAVVLVVLLIVVGPLAAKLERGAGGHH
jgi:uncharacterized membrane protein